MSARESSVFSVFIASLWSNNSVRLNGDGLGAFAGLPIGEALVPVAAVVDHVERVRTRLEPTARDLVGFAVPAAELRVLFRAAGRGGIADEIVQRRASRGAIRSSPPSRKRTGAVAAATWPGIARQQKFVPSRHVGSCVSTSANTVSPSVFVATKSSRSSSDFFGSEASVFFGAVAALPATAASKSWGQGGVATTIAANQTGQTKRSGER